MTDYVAALNDLTNVYHREARRLADRFPNDATIIEGVIRWNSNDRVPPEDYVTLAAHIGLPVDVAACDRARETEQRAFLADYRRRQALRTPKEIAEQRAEARAAMGPGIDMVNIVTDERYRT